MAQSQAVRLGINAEPIQTGTRTFAEVKDSHPFAFTVTGEARERKARKVTGDAAIMLAACLRMVHENQDAAERIMNRGDVASFGVVPENRWSAMKAACRKVWGVKGVAFKVVRASESTDGEPRFKVYKPRTRNTSGPVELDKDTRAALLAYIKG